MKKIHQTLSGKQFRAFSLMEMSFILLALSLIIAAIPVTTSFIRNHKVVGAQAITNDAPVHNVEGLVFWLETAKAESFFATEGKDGRIVNTWRDINPQSPTKLNALAATADVGDSTKISYNQVISASTTNTKGPTYVKNGINNLASLNFANASDQFRYLVIDNKFSVNPIESMTLFFVFSYHSGQGFLIDRVCRDGDNIIVTNCDNDIKSGLPLFGLAINASKQLLFYAKSDAGSFGSFGDDYFNTGFTINPGTPYIITLERDFGQNFTIYINGNATLATTASKTDASGTNAGAPISLAPFKIGRHFSNTTDENLNFDLSEFLFFNQPVKSTDRQEIENYLGKKYGILVSR